MRSLTSPVIAPLYTPTQARSDCSASRSASAIAFAVSSGFCSAGRTGTAATAFGLVPAVEGGVICASAEVPNAATSNVAESTDLMTNPEESLRNGWMDCWSDRWRSLTHHAIMHICLVGNNRAAVQEPRLRN